VPDLSGHYHQRGKYGGNLDAEILVFLLGISVAIIGVLVPALGLSMRNSKGSNPSMDTIDDKLNQILLALTRIEERLGGQ